MSLRPANSDQVLVQILEAVRELNEDQSVPRNVKLKFERIIKTLEEKTDISVIVDRVQQDLDEIADDSNLQAYTRTQIWNIVSLLEKL